MFHFDYKRHINLQIWNKKIKMNGLVFISIEDSEIN